MRAHYLELRNLVLVVVFVSDGNKLSNVSTLIILR